MIKIQSPFAYIQGPGAMDKLGEYVKNCGEKFFIISGGTAYRQKKDIIEKSFADNGLVCHFELFGGECCDEEISRLLEISNSGKYNAVIGIGGGKVIDTSKAVASRKDVPVIICPTLASSDAPCSSVAVIYTKEGAVLRSEYSKTNPYMVIVDSTVIANAPAYQLVAGMGDAAATYLEARASYERGWFTPLRQQSSVTAQALGKLAYDILMKDGYLAKLAVEKKTVSRALENVIEANIYLSGVGFESGGISCAHSIQNALTEIHECHLVPHGYRVAFGSMCLLVAENRPWEEIEQLIAFNASVGLPVTLEEIGLVEDVEAKLKKIMPIAFVAGNAHSTCMPLGVTEDSLYSAILVADELGKEFLSRNPKA